MRRVVTRRVLPAVMEFLVFLVAAIALAGGTLAVR